MKISVKTLDQLNDRYKTLATSMPLDDNELVEKIGAQLGAIENLIPLDDKYKGIIISKVVSCEDHPNADKLHVCFIDDAGAAQNVERNEQGYVQVVCGAPNVRAGLSVAWLPPGSTVPESFDHEPFILEARDLRGVISNGMLASPKELAIGDSHEGILEIDGDLKPGTDFAEAFAFKDDFVIDIENKMFTHRPDCFGWLGVAREIAGISGVQYKSPDWYSISPEVPAVETDLPIKIINEIPELVPRFSAIAMSDIEIKPSPVWLQVKLAKVGLRPINSIVDLTNFFMLETGQPLHAYDYDKVKALSGASEAILSSRLAKKGEKLKLLNGKEIEPKETNIIIATDTKAIGLAGVMGGFDTEVDESTKNIIIECANFDMYSIRRTSMEYGLFSDAVTRFTKGQSPLQNLAVLLKIVDDVKNIASGKVASVVLDDNHLSSEVMSRGSLYLPVSVNNEFINVRLGLNLSKEEIKTLLTNVEFKVEEDNDGLIVTAPFWRTDIELPEDIVEEIGRLYGYDKLPLALPDRLLTPVTKNPLLSGKAQIRRELSSLGANEVLTYSFVHEGLLSKVGQDKANAYEVDNALRPELQYYRLSLMPSLLDKVHPNIKAGQDKFALFEIGKVHDVAWVDQDGLPEEHEYTALVIAGADKLKDKSSAYYLAKRYLSLISKEELEFKPFTDDVLVYQVTKPYEPKRSAMVYLKDSQEFLGLVGEFNSKTRRNLKLPRYSAGFEVDTKVLVKAINKTSYSALSRFPKVTQDISLKVKDSVSYQELETELKEAIDKAKPEHSSFTLTPRDIYQGEDKSTKNITLRLEITSNERTLTDKEVSNLLDSCVVKLSVSSERL